VPHAGNLLTASFIHLDPSSFVELINLGFRQGFSFRQGMLNIYLRSAKSALCNLAVSRFMQYSAFDEQDAV
jgi:hypothetical protein